MGSDHTNSADARRRDTGWWIAAALFTVGAGFSIFGNIADADPTPIARAFGVVWPLALLGSLEIMSRRRFPPGLHRLAARVGLGVVAIVAATVSYQHLYGLLGAHGESHLTAIIGPFAIDGLMLICAAAMLNGVEDASPPTPATKQLQTQEVKPAPAPTARKPRPRRTTKRKVRAVPIVDPSPELLAHARKVAAELAANGEKINRENVLTLMRRDNMTVSDPQRDAIMRTLRAEHAKTNGKV